MKCHDPTRSGEATGKRSFLGAYLVPCQDFEGGHDLVGSVCIGSLSGHEVDEGLEGDEAQSVGVHNAHDARELCLAL